MTDTYFIYNNRGQCSGILYSPDPPFNLDEGLNYVKLSYEQINQMNYDHSRYVYKNGVFQKLPEIVFCVSPSNIYTLGQHNKISISIKPDRDTSPEEQELLSNKLFNVKINEELHVLNFGEILLVEPESVGVYLIELTNDDIVCSNFVYAITAVEPAEPNAY